MGWKYSGCGVAHGPDGQDDSAVARGIVICNKGARGRAPVSPRLMARRFQTCACSSGGVRDYRHMSVLTNPVYLISGEVI